jgi:hypothetical protein
MIEIPFANIKAYLRKYKSTFLTTLSPGYLRVVLVLIKKNPKTKKILFIYTCTVWQKFRENLTRRKM